MVEKTWKQERIERLQRDIGDEKKGEGRPGNWEAPYRIHKLEEELHRLTTPPKERIKEIDAQFDYINSKPYGSRSGLGNYDYIKSLSLERDRLEEEISGVSSKTETSVQNSSSTTRPTTPQGDTRSLQQRGKLHTPTMSEIVADANKPDPTVPYFDTNSDFMRQVDPLAPHYDLSGDFPRQVNPLKPGPKIPSGGD